MTPINDLYGDDFDSALYEEAPVRKFSCPTCGGPIEDHDGDECD